MHFIKMQRGKICFVKNTRHIKPLCIVVSRLRERESKTQNVSCTLILEKITKQVDFVWKAFNLDKWNLFVSM